MGEQAMSEKKNWEDPFPPDPPLDIRMVADVISLEFMRCLEQARQRSGSNVYAYPKEVLEIRDKVIEVLRSYDEARTQHLNFLRNELIRIHEVGLPPTILQMENNKIAQDPQHAHTWLRSSGGDICTTCGARR